MYLNNNNDNKIGNINIAKMTGVAGKHEPKNQEHCTKEDASNVLDIIKNSKEYAEIYDVDFDDKITIKDFQAIAIGVSEQNSLDEIKEKIEDRNKKTNATPSDIQEIIDRNYEDNLKIEKLSGIKINGKIDDSAQGEIGDCWLLAGINSLSYSKLGENVLKNSIQNNKNGTYTVALKGVNFSCDFTSSDIKYAKQSGRYSSGDSDILLMELAVEKFFEAYQDGKVKLPKNAPNFNKDKIGSSYLYGGNFRDIIYLLTGKNTKYQYNCYHPDCTSLQAKLQQIFPGISELFGNTMENVYNKFEKNPDNIAGCISFYGGENSTGLTSIKDINNDDVILTDGTSSHAWSIKSVQGKYVTLTNPWDSSVEIIISKNEIQKYATGINYFEFK